ncbi:enoyl-CoA hydratase-related protein [Paenibacillus sp. N1-5-1-14]|uniref:enoyl-CoA hydratase-related protein n=1 Tax=Paenibacillus radicibacter TaxID=2972488 RepID=UPI00215933AF|nr:enoyl-CoA hydratase-related protein [Paenibacillus radicibacter]MCR8641822.1 enoyl-CoA hydratase-related protein [Paenibacillus radicibacter]
MLSESVGLEKQGYIAILRLNRPDDLNALNYETLVQLGEKIEELRLDVKETRVVILTASGKAFSAGADLKERRTLNEQQVRRNVNKIREVCTLLERLPQPTIAAMNGHAFGGGLELTLSCDFRYAVRGAKLGLTEVSLGIIPGAGGTQRLPRLIGIAKAKEWILTARRVDVEEALGCGLLQGVAEDQEHLMELYQQLASEILANAPLAVYQAKYAVDRGYSVDMQTGLDLEAKAYEVIIPTQDRIEALEAFREKRKPIFRGE